MASSDLNDKSDPDVEEGESSSADLRFLTFTNFSQTTDAATRRKVRSHVMHGVQQNLKRGKAKERRGDIELDISALPQATAGPLRQAPGQLIVSNPQDLGAGSSDPFSRYPIQMDVRSHELFAHCKHPDTGQYLGNAKGSSERDDLPNAQLLVQDWVLPNYSRGRRWLSSGSMHCFGTSDQIHGNAGFYRSKQSRISGSVN